MRWSASCLLLALGCAHPVPPASPPPWVWEARAIQGEVRVVPVLAPTQEDPLNLSSFIGGELPGPREALRRERTAQLGEVRRLIGLSVPGAVNGHLGTAWQTQLHLTPWPPGTRLRLDRALRHPRRLDGALSEAAQAVGGDATLFTWVSDVEGLPLSIQGFPGDIIRTSVGPVIIDHAEEPYLITAKLGVAMVACDGEVLLRYEDTFESVLSAQPGPEVVAQDLAHRLLQEVGKVWATDPTL